jgi:hypothetical protein
MGGALSLPFLRIKHIILEIILKAEELMIKKHRKRADKSKN